MQKKDLGKVLIAASVHRILTEGLADAGYECIIEEKITQQKAFDLIRDCVAVVTSTRLQLDKRLIDAASELRWIGRMGSGMEVIDVSYAENKGITCFSSPEGNSNAVAEHALGMLLGVTKHIAWSNLEVKQGLWLRDQNRGMELEGKTIGIIGFGHTGRAFARKLQGFDMKIMVFDKYCQDDIPSQFINCGDLTPIFEQADIISFHVPMQEDTIHYLNENFITKMTKGFIVINTSRGIVVDTKALWEGLESGKIKGACLDVLEEEPIEKMSGDMRQLLRQISDLPNVIITPHIAGYSVEALYKMSKILLYKILTLKK
ncbi:MAG TPA: NAD(P)-dependent oxidoreductase [Flavipsychrobacter sp.]|nr:NAD(P)-dependent oxidoreductase [Flavipsychrobacter sp.]